MQPQTDSICDSDGRVIVDFTGRFENLESDFETVQSKIGIPNRRIRHNNSSRSGPTVHNPTQGIALDGVTSADLDYLTDRFAQDFRLFDYSPTS
jgi:hypothetical protein